MNFFISTSLDDLESIVSCRAIIAYLHDSGHVVLNLEYLKPIPCDSVNLHDHNEYYNQNIHWVKIANIMIAEISTPSLEVGYLLADALIMDKPTFCCYRKGLVISPVLASIDNQRLYIYSYSDDIDLLESLQGFMIPYLDDLP